jgi:hypothetical protein
MAGLGDRLGARKQLASEAAAEINAIPWACHEGPIFAIGDRVRILRRVPIRHYRVPTICVEKKRSSKGSSSHRR